MWESDNGAPELPDKKEQERRKKILEDDFVKCCPEYGWDRKKALWALKEGILTMEPLVFDWADDWPSGSLNWAEGFDNSYLCEPFEKTSNQ